MRLAQGPVRPVLADRPRPPLRAGLRPRPRARPGRHRGDARDAEDRDRRPRGRRRRGVRFRRTADPVARTERRRPWAWSSSPTRPEREPDPEPVARLEQPHQPGHVVPHGADRSFEPSSDLLVRSRPSASIVAVSRWRSDTVPAGPLAPPAPAAPTACLTACQYAKARSHRAGDSGGDRHRPPPLASQALEQAPARLCHESRLDRSDGPAAGSPWLRRQQRRPSPGRCARCRTNCACGSALDDSPVAVPRLDQDVADAPATETTSRLLVRSASIAAPALLADREAAGPPAQLRPATIDHADRPPTLGINGNDAWSSVRLADRGGPETRSSHPQSVRAQRNLRTPTPRPNSYSTAGSGRPRSRADSSGARDPLR